jgi:hypothetical protein
MHEAVGHAVRANYLYAGVADVYAESCDHTLMHTLEQIAEDVATQKLYITGMTGALYDGASPYASRRHSEIQTVHQAYGIDYQLPNKTAYNETCATIGYAMWNWRMFTLTGEAHYADLFEQSLYNGILPGISLDGTKYFYVNALQKIDAFDWPMRWSRVREPNIPSSFCCPPNVVRTIAEVQNYVYSLSHDTVWVNLYAGSSLDTGLREGGRIRLSQSTDYPWDGRVVLTIAEAPERPLAIRLRIPAWAPADGLAVAVNGEPAAGPPVPGTYHAVTRVWKPGDTLALDIRLEPSFWESHPLVEETANQVAVKYGPLVYCLETPDVPEGTGLLDIALDPTRGDFRYTLERDTIVNANVVNIRIQARRLNRSSWGESGLYRPVDTGAPAPVETRWIPYFAWGNRGDHEMTVWVPLR